MGMVKKEMSKNHTDKTWVNVEIGLYCSFGYSLYWRPRLKNLQKFSFLKHCQNNEIFKHRKGIAKREMSKYHTDKT